MPGTTAAVDEEDGGLCPGDRRGDRSQRRASRPAPVHPTRRWWADRGAGQARLDQLISLASPQSQWYAGARDPGNIDLEQANADQGVIDLPGRHNYMEALLWDYRTNPPAYPGWQQWLRVRQPKVLAVWGANEPIFAAPGAEALARDVADATVVLLDTGLFALEEEADAISAHVHELLTATFG